MLRLEINAFQCDPAMGKPHPENIADPGSAFSFFLLI